jgi:hypothetical protein
VGRKEVLVRVVGDRACGWEEAASVRGADVEVVVHQDKHNHGVSELLSLRRSMEAEAASQLWPGETWEGLLLATARGAAGGRLAGRFIKLWQPLRGVLAMPAGLSREEHHVVRREALAGYGGKAFGFTLSHATVGGVTDAWWRFLLFARAEGEMKPGSWLTRNHYPRTLQTVLDDTIGRGAPPDSLIVHSA